MRLLCGALVVVAAALPLIGCGEDSQATGGGSSACLETAAGATLGKRPKESRDAWISLDGFMGPESAGILTAAERGYFAAAGLDVTITSAATPDGPLGYVREEIVDFGVAHQPEVVAAREEGAPVIAVGALVPRPTAAMIWLQESKIEGIADLEGKTIGLPGIPYQRDLLRYVLADGGLTLDDVKVQRVGYESVAALVNGRADAIFGGSWNLEVPALRARGLKPVVTRVGKLGVPDYEELVVVARADRAAQDPRLIHDFMTAVARGNAAAVNNPKEAVELIEEGGEHDLALGRKATEAAVEATLPLLAETNCMDADQASELIDWMAEEELVESEPPTSDLLTNRYVTP